MTDEQNIAPELMEAFDRLMRYAPPEVANDEQVRKNIFIYLRLGGERLARQYLQIIQKIFPEKIVLKKIKLSDESEEDTKDDNEDKDKDENDDENVDAESDDEFDC